MQSLLTSQGSRNEEVGPVLLDEVIVDLLQGWPSPQ